MEKQKMNQASNLTLIEEFQPIADDVAFELSFASKIEEIDRSPKSRLEKSKDVMRRQIEQADAEIKKTNAEAEVLVEKAKADEKQANERDQERIDAWQEQIKSMMDGMKARSVEAKATIADINGNRDCRIDALNELRASAEAFLAASARGTN